MTKKRRLSRTRPRLSEPHTTSASTVGICKKYGLTPHTFRPWRDMFLGGGVIALAGSPNTLHQGNPKGECCSKDVGGRDLPVQRSFKKALGGRMVGTARSCTAQGTPEQGPETMQCGQMGRYCKPKRHGLAINQDMLCTIQEMLVGGGSTAREGWPRRCPECRAGRSATRRCAVYARRFGGTSPGKYKPQRPAGRGSGQTVPTMSGRRTSCMSGSNL